MTTRLPVTPAPGPLELFAQHFDPLFPRYNQHQAFRDNLAGLLLPAERNKTLTALANTEAVVGAQAAPAQRLEREAMPREAEQGRVEHDGPSPVTDV
jgi:hypothetical protein